MCVQGDIREKGKIKLVRDESIVSGLELRGANDLAKRRGLYSVLTRGGRKNKEKR